MSDSVRIEVTDLTLGALKRIIDTLEAVYDVSDASRVIEAEASSADKYNGPRLALRVVTGEDTAMKTMPAPEAAPPVGDA